MARPLIEAKLLKGFRDYSPRLALLRSEMIACLARVFQSFGFAPIDTPALEYSEILLGKGSDETDKQLFRFTDQGGRDVALRFDLTVPLARFVAMNINELGTPFRRYHIAPVWRAEKPQRGRYREFMQCDFDIVGTRSILADSEIILVINAALNALKIKHQIRLNNRLILNGLLNAVGKQDSTGSVLRAIDKLDKLGKEVVHAELKESAKLSEKQIANVFSFLDLSTTKLNSEELLVELKKFFKDNDLALQGISAVEQVLMTVTKSGLSESECKIDLTIARGLDYYTGSVFETTMSELPEIGSICSGGRYDNLVSLYSDRELPGVGTSIGLDRILGAYEALGKLPNNTSPAKVFVAILDAHLQVRCAEVAQMLRSSGLATEIALEASKLGNQIKYASRKGIKFVVIAGSREFETEKLSVKNIETGEQEDNIPLSGLALILKKQLEKV